MSAVYPGSGPVSTTYVPNFEASGKIVIGYSRNPKDFPVNQYVTLVPVKQSTGYYLKRTVENAARLLSTTLADHAWADGNDAPTGVDNLESHLYKKFLTERYAYAFRIGYKAVDQADWPIVAAHAADSAQQAMTGRTLLVSTVLEDANNWNSNNKSDAVTWAGAYLDQGTADGTGNGYVYKKALQKAGIAINKGTFATIKPKELVVRINPDVAEAVSRSTEIHAYLKESPFALAQVRGDVESQNGLWGLPDMLYGFKHVIEDAVYSSNKKGETFVPGYVADSNKLVILARPGKLVGVQGAPSFSTAIVWLLEDMTVESKDDPDHRRHNHRVVDEFGTDIVSDISGFYLSLALHS